jgi:hypothetical protein
MSPSLSQSGTRLHIITMPDLENSSDDELLRAAKSEPEAFDELFRRHAVRLDSWFRARVPEREAAADLVSETFAQALVAATSFRGVRERSAISWLYGIALTSCFSTTVETESKRKPAGTGDPS